LIRVPGETEPAVAAESSAFIPVAKVKDVKPGQIKTVRARGGYEIALALVDGRIYAFDAYCPHQRWPLKWGATEGTTLVCGLHGWCFDLGTGDALEPPLAECLQVYPVRIEGDVVQVGIYAR
jgi:nitrite reductase/ring-hydroxylating ferredoxin subunit